MLPDKVWITATHKFNLGNYESAEYSASVSAALDNGENPIESLDTLLEIANQAIQDRIPQSYKRNNPNFSERFTKFCKQVNKEELNAYDEDE